MILVLCEGGSLGIYMLSLLFGACNLEEDPFEGAAYRGKRLLAEQLPPVLLAKQLPPVLTVPPTVKVAREGEAEPGETQLGDLIKIVTENLLLSAQRDL